MNRNSLPIWRNKTRAITRQTNGRLYWPMAVTTSIAYLTGALIAFGFAFY